MNTSYKIFFAILRRIKISSNLQLANLKIISQNFGNNRKRLLKALNAVAEFFCDVYVYNSKIVNWPRQKSTSKVTAPRLNTYTSTYTYNLT